MEPFHKFLSKISVLLMIHGVWWPNLSKIGRCEVAEKLSGIADKKPRRRGHFLAPPVSPPLSQSRPKFRERCRLLPWVGVPTLDRIGCGLPDLFRKESKKVKTIIIGFQPTIFFIVHQHTDAQCYIAILSVRLSVCLSVCPSRSGILSKLLDILL